MLNKSLQNLFYSFEYCISKILVNLFEQWLLFVGGHFFTELKSGILNKIGKSVAVKRSCIGVTIMCDGVTFSGKLSDIYEAITAIRSIQRDR